MKYEILLYQDQEGATDIIYKSKVLPRIGELITYREEVYKVIFVHHVVGKKMIHLNVKRKRA